MSATLEQVEQVVQSQPAMLQAISDTNAAVLLQGGDIEGMKAVIQQQDERIKALEYIMLPKVVNVKDYAKGDGITYDDDAIMAAQDKALAAGLPLSFPAGNYLCRQSRVTVKSKAKWQGEAGARLFTKESAVYNIAFKIADTAEDVSIDGLIFDQMSDAIQTPIGGNALKGCHLVHAGNYRNLKITNNILNGYGMVHLFLQPWDGYGNWVEVRGNKATSMRRTNVLYDCSAYNLDGLDGIIENNTAQCIANPGINDWKMESGFEIHLPKGTVRNNTATDYINGLLFVGWPNFMKYNAAYVRNLLVEGNTVRGAQRAISLWGDNRYKNTGREFANVIIRNNDLQCSLLKYGTTENYYNVCGHIVCDNSLGGAMETFKNFEIYGNKLTTVSPYGMGSTLWNFRSWIEQTGGFNLNSSNKCVGWNIHDNEIQFPYSVFMLRTTDTARPHDGITIRNNKLTDCTIYRMYDDKQPVRGFDAIYVMENAKNILAEKNPISGKAPVAMTKYGANVGNATIK